MKSGIPLETEQKTRSALRRSLDQLDKKIKDLEDDQSDLATILLGYVAYDENRNILQARLEEVGLEIKALEKMLARYEEMMEILQDRLSLKSLGKAS